MTTSYLTSVISNEFIQFKVTLKSILRWNFAAVILITAFMLIDGFNRDLDFRDTYESVYYFFIEMYAPLLGVLLLSDLLSREFETDRAELLQTSAQGMVRIAWRKILHGFLILTLLFFFLSIIWPVFRAPVNILFTIAIALPGAMYYGMIGLMAATLTRRSLAGYTAGIAFFFLTTVSERFRPLESNSYDIRDKLGVLRFLEENNWMIAKVYFAAVVILLLYFLLQALHHPHQTKRCALFSLALLVSCYFGANQIWTRTLPERPAIAAEGMLLDTWEQNDQLHVHYAQNLLAWQGDRKRETVRVTETLYEKVNQQWVKKSDAVVNKDMQIRITAMDIEARIIPADLSLDATAQITARVPSDRSHQLYFEIPWEYQIEWIAVNENKAKFHKYGNLVSVTAPQTFQKSESVQLSIKYHGQFQPFRKESESFQEDYISTRRWYPTVENNDLIPMNATLLVPSGYSMVGGKAINVDNTWKVYRVEQYYTRFLPLCMGRFSIHTRVYDGKPLILYARTIQKKFAEAILDQCVESLAHFEKLYGDYPHQQLALVEAPHQDAGGLADPGMVRIHSNQWKREKRESFFGIYLPHEIAHQWWSYAFPQFICEGMAAFSNFDYLLEKGGLELTRNPFFDITRINPMFKQSMSPLIYAGSGPFGTIRSGFFFIMMREQMGKDRFHSLIKSYYQRWAMERSPDPEQQVAEIMDQLRSSVAPELQTFVDQWLKSVDIYDPTLKSLLQTQETNGYRVIADLENKGKIRYPVPIRFTFQDGTHLDRIWDATADQEVREWTFAQPVQSAELHPDKIALDWEPNNNKVMAAFIANLPVKNTSSFTRTVRGWTTFTTADGLLSSDVKSLFVDNQGRLFAGLQYGSFDSRWSLNWFDGQWHHFKDEIVNQNRISQISALAQAPDGALWLAGRVEGHLGTGLIRMKDNDASISYLKEFRSTMNLGHPTFTPNPESNSGLMGCWIYQLIFDSANRLWVGTDHGINLHDPTTNQWRYFSTQDGLPGNEVLTLYEDSQGTVWAGTEHGVACYRNNQWQTQPQLGHDFILSMVEDRCGRMWLGTYRSGILILDPEQVQAYTPNNSVLRHAMITALARDAAGRIWAGTPEGLTCFDGSHTFTWTTQNSGLLSNRIRLLTVDRNQTLWIGTDQGITSFDLRELNNPPAQEIAADS